MENSTSTLSKMTWHHMLNAEELISLLKEHIKELSGDTWTDHNLGDPGITIAEVLCLAIADLSYRTGFDIKDILASYTGDKTTSMDLAPADVVLPNHPVTLLDIRKVLVDIPHPDSINTYKSRLLLRNAWPAIANQSEKNIYYHPHATVKPLGTLSVKAILENQQAGNYLESEKINLQGLYEIQIEFEYDEHQSTYFLKDLNQNYFEGKTAAIGNGIDYEFSVLFPYWDEVNWRFKDIDLEQSKVQFLDLEKEKASAYFIAIDKANYDEFFFEYYAEFTIDNIPLTASVKLKDPLQIPIKIGEQTEVLFTIQWVDWHELANQSNRNYEAAIREINVIDVSGNISLDISKKVFDIQIGIILEGAEEAFSILARAICNADNALPSLIVLQNELRNVFGPYKKTNSKSTSFPIAFEYQIQLENQIYQSLSKANGTVFKEYQQKIKRVYELIYETNGVWNYIHRYRNLGEDILKIMSSRIQEIALFGDIIIKPGYNANEVLAEAYFQVAEFLNPSIKFHTLNEMKEKGLEIDKIFNGPLLTHGFIDDQSFETNRNKAVVYTSDLIRLIMNVEGVEAIIDFSISSYIDNRLIGRNVVDCLDLTYAETYKPRFSLTKSKLNVSQNAVTPALSFDTLQKYYEIKHAAAKTNQIPQSPYYDLTPPAGIDRKIDKYYSVQHDFPEIYGIGTYGLADDVTDERKALAKQLKAFLLPFEQLLANYLKQITSLPELFSFSNRIDRTYHHQPLYEVPDIAPLLKPFLTSGETWDRFKTDLDNVYQKFLRSEESANNQSIAQNRFTWLQRRNEFLDHLLGRFAETFEEYALIQLSQIQEILKDPSQYEDYEKKRGKILTELIKDKELFAQDYQAVATKRANGFDYNGKDNNDIKGQDNKIVSGYKQRLCRLLGIRQTGNQPIFGGKDSFDIDVEGMHVVEHILLRPKTDEQILLEFNTNAISYGNGQLEKDPYSFHISVVLPKDAGRFKDSHFREYTETIIYRETPAHITVNICWMDHEYGKRFETAYLEWLQILQNVKPHLIDDNSENYQRWTEIHNQLITSLQDPIEPELKVLDAYANEFTSIDETIAFWLGEVDIHYISVSRIGGNYRIFFKETDEWIEKETVEITSRILPITQQGKGFAALNGIGQFRIDYYPDGVEKSKEVFVYVNKKATPIFIYAYDTDGSEPLVDEYNNPITFLEIDRNQNKEYVFEGKPFGGDLFMYSEENGQLKEMDHFILTEEKSKISFTELTIDTPGEYLLRYVKDKLIVQLVLMVTN
ncbi:hypothetical protein [Aquimarina longa]|uniref:hypothetical protein n=1 Tax=Aquimarina longa TaxID=1080221 RepID=UPI000782AB3F|nr:hypothetical protein [Aquimarina longa]